MALTPQDWGPYRKRGRDTDAQRDKPGGHGEEMAVCTPRRAASGGTGPARTRIPASRTGRGKFQPEPWGGLWASPGPTRRTGTVPPGTDRGDMPPCSYETCRDPQLHLSHLGGGTEASRAGSLCEEPSKLRADLQATQPASPARMPTAPTPSQAPGHRAPEGAGCPARPEPELSGRGSAAAE